MWIVGDICVDFLGILLRLVIPYVYVNPAFEELILYTYRVCKIESLYEFCYKFSRLKLESFLSP